MSALLRVIHVEDDPADAELVADTLRAAGVEAAITRVSTAAELREAVAVIQFDLALSDYHLPGFGGMEALRQLQAEAPGLPVIILSGAIGEERAIECMQAGATDYVLKDRLARLVPAVNRIRAESRERSRREAAEEALEDSHQLLERIISANPNAFFIYDFVAERVVYAGGRTETVLGLPIQELLVERGDPLQRVVGAEDLRRLAEHQHQVEVATDQDIVELEVRVMRTRGERNRRWLQVRSVVFERQGGRASRGLSVVADITDRREVETQLLRNQRLESIGTMAGGIAHDLNNILAPIAMAAEILERTVPGEHEQGLLATILSSSQRGASLVRQILLFARGVEGERTLVDLRRLVQDTLGLMQETFPKVITIRGTMPEALWPVVGDVTQLYQVLLNLCLNARDAMPSGGTLDISLDNVVLDDAYARVHLEADAGRYLLLSVTDSGTGIPEGELDRIFEPFFTTKPVGQGTGLGLSTARSIIKAHGGFLNVYTAVGEGTSFKVYLPAASTDPTAPREDAPPPMPQGHGELVVVADDEEAIRDLARVILERHGYRVLTAADGAEAVALVARSTEPVAALVTDARMPVLDGPGAIRAIRHVDRRVRCLLASGMFHDIPDGVRHLQKPYTARELLEAVRTLLDEPAPES